jgi:phosphoribosylglycinamide formyltransferase-1
MKRARVVVLISGGGTNLQALMDASKHPDSAYDIVAVISNRPLAGGLDRASQAGIKTHTLDHKAYPSRDAFDEALAAQIDACAADFVACAGFMRVLTAAFVDRYEGRLVNIHPSLLPSFKGLHTHARAIESGIAFTGCTVHWVNNGVDEGAIIGQAIVPILPDDSPDALAHRVLAQEHRLYPLCLNLIAAGRLTLKEARSHLDGRPHTIAMMPDGAIVQHQAGISETP